MAHSDEHEPPGLISELVASITAMVDEKDLKTRLESHSGFSPGAAPTLVQARAKKAHRDAGTQAVWGYIVKILYLAA